MNVYVPYININNYLYETFGAFEYKHFSSVLLENLLANEKNSEELKMYVHVANKHFEIIVIESGKLLLYNSFELQTKEDLIYYILFITEQLNLNPETFKLILLGTIQKNDDLIYNSITIIIFLVIIIVLIMLIKVKDFNYLKRDAILISFTFIGKLKSKHWTYPATLTYEIH